jgi:Protein of unknown function (DUF295)
MSSPKKKNACIMNQVRGNWAELNPDLLYTISKKLCDCSDFIMLRAVCKAWRSATNPSDPPLQFPCLIAWPYLEGSTLRIYSPASQRTHTFHVPDASFYGPTGQDVLIRSPSDLDLYELNPLTRLRKKKSYEDYCLDQEHLGFRPRIGKFEMIKFLKPRDAFYFRQSVKHPWTIFHDLRSVVYYKNCYFLLESTIVNNSIRVIYKNDKLTVSRIPFPSKGFDSNYLITTNDSLLAISTSIPVYLKDLKKSQFEVHRLDNYPQNPHWTKLSAIGDLMLFLDHCSCFSLKASDYSGFRGNCIYFITHSTISRRRTKHVIGRFDMELNQVEEHSGPAWFGERNLSVKAAWFVPSL